MIQGLTMRLTDSGGRLFVLGLILAWLLFLGGGAIGRSRIVSYSSIIDIETEEVADYMTFEGSQLVPIVKATVSCRQADGATPAESAERTKYEELWYRAGDALGCTGAGQLGSHELALTQIKIHSKSNHPSRFEIAAQANALVRVYLDAYLRTGILTSVVVPDDGFESLIASLEQENFFKGDCLYGAGLEASILLPIQNESGTNASSLHFNNAR
jgi:hypothetical protein